MHRLYFLGHLVGSLGMVLKGVEGILPSSNKVLDRLGVGHRSLPKLLRLKVRLDS